MPQRRYNRRRKGRITIPRKIWKSLPKKRILFWFATALGVTLLWAAGVVLWWSKDLPDPENIHQGNIGESTKIYDSTGSHLLYEVGEIRRTYTNLDNISNHVIQATIAAEDDQFYEHKGINLRGIIRAAWVNFRGGNRQGGSTITQQLIKNSILTPEQTMQRKVKEAVLALELEQRLKKDEILELYLNAIPYGSRSYGIEAAAQTFFGASASDVSLAQATILAALPNAPSFYSPHGSNVEALKARQEHILRRMVSLEMISQEQAIQAREEGLTFRPPRENIEAPHFVFYVKQLLEEEYGEHVIEQGGLTILTTLNMEKQRIAEEALKNAQESLNQRGASNAAVVSIDPKNGDIVTMAGSIDYFNSDIHGNVNVTIRHRSPGSSIKPFVYAAAFKKGYTPDTILVDAETDFGQGYKPQNYNLTQSGPVSMRAALATSLNIPAVKTLYLAGVNESVKLAQEMGMTSLNDPNRYGLSLVLGGGDVRPLDLASAYATLAHDGTRYEPRAILKVQQGDNILFDISDEKDTSKQVLDEQIARLTTDVLADNNARASVFGVRNHLQLGSRPVAAKTGTTQNFRDGWTGGYTPSLATVVWTGNNDNTPMSRGADGSLTAAPIWNEFMRRALEGSPIEQFTKPEQLNPPHRILRGQIPEVKGKWVEETKMLYTEDCPVALGHHKTVRELRSILYYVQKNDPQGDAPSSSNRDSQFANWEGAVDEWIERHNEEHGNNPEKPLYAKELPEPVCDIGDEDDLPKVQIVEPNKTILQNSPTTVKVDIDSKHDIREVRFILDGEELVRRHPGEPKEAQISFDSSFSGRKTLLILAITENNFIGRAHRTFIINPDENPPEATLHTPQNNVTLQKTDFPYTVKVTATDDSGIEFVDVLYRKEGEEGARRIGRTSTQAPIAPDRYEIVWENKPTAGTYHVYVIAYDTTGNFTETPIHTVVIEDDD